MVSEKDTIMAAGTEDYFDDFEDDLDDGALVAVTSNEVALDTTPLTTETARQLTDHIRNASEVLWVLIARAHAGKAWEALGYETWGDYVKVEFDMSRSRSYQILDQARVIQAIEAAVPEDMQVRISESAARDLKGVLDDVLPEIRERLAGVAPDEAQGVLEEIVEEQRDRIREQREAAAAADDDDYDDYIGGGGGSGYGDGEYNGDRGGNVPMYDDIDDIDVAKIRRNVNAAHDLYSSLSALASLPDELDEVVAIIPEERHTQIDSNLDKAIEALTRFADLWRDRDLDED